MAGWERPLGPQGMEKAPKSWGTGQEGGARPGRQRRGRSGVTSSRPRRSSMEMLAAGHSIRVAGLEGLECREGACVTENRVRVSCVTYSHIETQGREARVCWKNGEGRQAAAENRRTWGPPA